MNQNSMDEDRVARRIRQNLDAGIEHLERRITTRLMEARRLALSHYVNHNTPPPHTEISTLLAVASWLRFALIALALGIGIAGTYYWHLDEEARANASIDSDLLIDDVPPSAYVDKGFRKWLERASSDSPQ